MFTVQTEMPLPASTPTRYTAMIYDGASFYFANGRESKIYQYGRCFCQERCFDTCRNYSNICYDSKEQCFWAISSRCRSSIFKLNDCFQEIDCLPIVAPGYQEELGRVTGISYDCGCDKLIVAFPSCVLRIDKYQHTENTLLWSANGEWLLNVLSVHPYIILILLLDGEQVIRIITSDGELLQEYHHPCTDRIESAVFIPTPDCSGCLHLMVLVSRKNCYPYIWNCVFQSETLDQPIFPFHDSKCGAFDKPQHCENSCDDVSCSDILQPIAMLQQAISQILTIEGNNLQKITVSSCNPTEIIEANRSVQTTLIHATHLEHLVYDMLENHTKKHFGDQIQ